MSNYQGYEYEGYEEKFPEEKMLEYMFNKQIKLQHRLKNDIYTQEYRMTMILAAIDELMEALRETPWKPWKKQQQYNKEAFREELIDVWHFLINLSLSSGMGYKETYDRFLKKNKENNNRQDKGY